MLVLCNDKYGLRAGLQPRTAAQWQTRLSGRNIMHTNVQQTRCQKMTATVMLLCVRAAECALRMDVPQEYYKARTLSVDL